MPPTGTAAEVSLDSTTPPPLLRVPRDSRRDGQAEDSAERRRKKIPGKDREILRPWVSLLVLRGSRQAYLASPEPSTRRKRRSERKGMRTRRRRRRSARWRATRQVEEEHHLEDF